ncbi:MAG: glutathione S-transferase N-terminal domain-containing protein [Mangrovicoccus sp.]|nr:glutathione S-transferase N-terminal domain-containing protein [Mangrovicoccus sp.]
MGNLKLYMAPGSCTTAIHILLEDLGEFFEAHIVNLPRGDHLKPDYVAINPKSTIPSLVRRDGTVLTETLGIAYWLARSNPRAGLWFDTPELETRALEIMGHVTATTHGQGFARVFSAGAFGGPEQDSAAISQMGREIVLRSFNWLEEVIAPGQYALGAYSVVDPILFYVCFWAAKTEIPVPKKLAAHFQRMLARPVVQRVLREEGYDPSKLMIAPAA